ncbi:tripartite tricarboxylate transporter TctB family protein [Bacillus norwichensis]|uniref:Tripartite tricarboxylate transporter TctB family protein n=1 Tax=Bacillus norwichensis TaxID=2762217 RepID=A0ABR8VHP4_9BACI|nr:tripartite tricarboxylate transporter TctB family protein [Bacillus norwichensis]MBD8003921.1 tripartite tricarboxylate transporter TctB family protein [Bacillus norwichensis]
MVIIKSKVDLISSSLLLVISLAAILDTRGLSEMSYVFPRTVCIILFLLSLIYFIKSLVKNEAADYFINHKRKVILVTSSMVCYFILISFIGFLPASIIYLAASIWILQKEGNTKRRHLFLFQAFPISIIISSAFYILFRYVFHVPLPEGLLGW